MEVLAENSSEHLNADEILQIALSKGYLPGIATVYRTLGLFEELKVMSRIYLNDGCIRYQLSDSDEKHEHHHLICECCGSVYDIEEDLLDSLERQVLLNNKFHVKNHRVKLFGI